MDYAHERELCSQLITALEYIVRKLEECPSEYPMLIADITCLVHGRVAVKSDGEKVLINGLLEQIKEMYQTLEALEMECDFGGLN